jgi:hypothetical protein
VPRFTRYGRANTSRRYCISCEHGDRPIQSSEERFFSSLDEIVGKIPVIVVFTRFDLVINKVRGVWMAKRFMDMASGKISRDAMISEVRGIAIKQYKDMKKKHWDKILNEHRIKVVRMSNPSPKDYDGDISDIEGECKRRYRAS